MRPVGDLEPGGVGVEHRPAMSRRFYCGAFLLLLAVWELVIKKKRDGQ